MKMRILVVEDEPVHYANLVSILEAIPETRMSGWKIDGLVFKLAESFQEAEALLKEAADQSSPYHILILDLKIPEQKGQLGGDTKYGFKILSAARRLSVANQIMIYTDFPAGGENIQKALRGGANEFIKKASEVGVGDHELQTQFMGCWQRVLSNESARLLELRVKDLIPYAEAGLAHRFTACFSDLVQTVAYTADDIERYASERFGLDRKKDAQDFLFRLLNKQDAELKAAQENWAALKADLSGGDETRRTEKLEALLDSVHETLTPCLVVKNVKLEKELYDAGQTRVLSFQDDMRVVIQEIVSGALSILPDFADERHIRVDLQVNSGQAEVKFSDDLPLKQSVPRADAQAINGGFSIGPNHQPTRFGRAWGLSVVQHIALRGGGRLIVTPQRAGGNQITYIVPLAL